MPIIGAGRSKPVCPLRQQIMSELIAYRKAGRTFMAVLLDGEVRQVMNPTTTMGPK